LLASLKIATNSRWILQLQQNKWLSQYLCSLQSRFTVQVSLGLWAFESSPCVQSQLFRCSHCSKTYTHLFRRAVRFFCSCLMPAELHQTGVTRFVWLVLWWSRVESCWWATKHFHCTEESFWNLNKTHSCRGGSLRTLWVGFGVCPRRVEGLRSKQRSSNQIQNCQRSKS